MKTAKVKLGEKIDKLLGTLEENKRIVRRNDKLIVDLQQKNEVSQMTIATSREKAMKKLKQKRDIQQ